MTTKAQETLYQQRERDYESSYRKLHSKTNEIHCLLDNNENSQVIQKHYTEWLVLRERYFQFESKYRYTLTEYETEQYEQLYAQREQYIEIFKSRVENCFTKNECNTSDTLSQTSEISRKSKVSQHSTNSNSSSLMRLQEEQRMAELAARASALKEKQRLASQRLELEQMEEELYLQTEMAVSNAKAKVLDQYIENEGIRVKVENETMDSYTKKAPSINNDGDINNTIIPGAKQIETHSHHNSVVYPLSTHVQQTATSSLSHNSNDVKGTPMSEISHHGNKTNSDINSNEQTNDAIVRLADILANRQDDLPKKEPDIFSGNVYDYPSWISSFEILVERRKSLASDRLYYLSKYTSGEAKEAIKGLITLNTDAAYARAKKILADRYGNKMVIAETYRKRIRDWPQIKYGDGYGKELRKFSDFLQQCETAMSSISYLGFLNDADEHKKILSKLPRPVVDRWLRIVDRWLNADTDDNISSPLDGCYPPFSELCLFLSKEARIACNPINMKPDEIKKDTYRRERFNKVSGARILTTATDEVKQSHTVNIMKPRHCVVCKEQHQLQNCSQFLNMNMTDRKTVVMSKGLCFACLKWGHRSQECRNKNICSKCQRPHPTALHDDSFKQKDKGQVNKDVPSDKESSTKTVVSCRVEVNSSDDIQQCSHSMIVPVMLHHKDTPSEQILVYALLDPQSDSCFVSESTLDKVHAKGRPITLKLSTMLTEQTITCQRVEGLVVSDINHNTDIALPATYTREVIPASHSQIPKPETVKDWPHLRKLADELPPCRYDIEIGLLIGLNCAKALKPREVIPGEDNDPYAIKTILGWGVIGVMNNSQNSDDSTCRFVGTNEGKCNFAYRTQTKEISPLEVNRMFEQDFNEHNSNDKVSVEDRRFLSKVQTGIYKRPDNHFEIPLPFKEDDVKLPNNRTMALKRLNSLRIKLLNDNQYRSDYHAFMSDIISKGHAERVQAGEGTDGHVWYIPHHGVYHPKKPGKIRIVFDCSAQYQGESLNRHLLQGPDLINNLTGVLCRFRQEQIAFTCDIEGMFHQVGVHPKDRDYLRFLWWENDDLNQDPVEYRMTVHLFGATSSPGCANFALKTAANIYESEYGLDTAEFVRRDFYVDDGLKSVETPEAAKSLIDSTTELCKKGGFRVHKFLSNSAEVIDSIPPEQRAKDIQNIDLNYDVLPIERTLGVQWCVQSDTFQFRIQLKDKPLTRRGILSTIGSVFDPLGLLAPLLLMGKRILQELTRDGADWDDEVPENIRTRWEQWRNELSLLSELKIQRCYKPREFGKVKTAELHHFSDASLLGYGQCSYLRLIDEQDRVSCSLVMAKSRVTPSRQITIPRLELTAAVTSVRVSNFLRSQLQYKIDSEVFWTDSNVVLGYISNDAKRFHIFVANRVEQIRESTSPDQWKYIDSKNNPADIASRGANANDISNNSLWWKGPAFLSTTSELPTTTESVTLNEDDPEVRKVITLATRVDNDEFVDILTRLESFSSWHKLKRAVAVCLRFKKRLMNRDIKKPKEHKDIKAVRSNIKDTYTPVNVVEICEAENVIIKLVQNKAFSKEIEILQHASTKGNKSDETDSKEQRQYVKKTSSLFRLDPCLDENGIIRVGGRIHRANLPRSVTHPVLLPKQGHITELVISHYHIRCSHSGRGMTLSQIRTSGYWVITCRAAVASSISKCVVCRKLRGKTQGQKMADLPIDRLQTVAPFTYSAVDYFGPFYVKEGRRELKRYGALFTCLNSRAIHIEIARSLTTDSFINAYRRFTCRRGPVRQLRCDQGTNFVGARGELAAALKEMDTDKVKRELLKDNCDFVNFKMNVPHSSHMGGVWERMIRTVRNVLSPMLITHGSKLDDELLNTLMIEAEAIVNSRPLTYVDMVSSDGLEPLSPSQLLTLKSQVVMPPPGIFQKEDVYCRRRWRCVQYLANEFWNRWKKEFLPVLQERSKWNTEQRDLQKGDVVLFTDETLPRCQWPLARVVDTYPGDDGRVRKVQVKVGQSTYDRPVHKLILLVSGESPVEEPKTD